MLFPPKEHSTTKLSTSARDSLFNIFTIFHKYHMRFKVYCADKVPEPIETSDMLKNLPHNDI